MSAADRLDAIEARANAARAYPVETWNPVDESATDVPALVAALRAVLALHRNEGGKCSRCLRYTSPMPTPENYPCADVRAIEEALS